MMDIPFTVDELVQALQGHRARRTGVRPATCARSRSSGYGEMGLNTLPCKVTVVDRVWPWGAYLGDDGVTKGVRMKVCSWPRTTTT